MSDLRKHLHAAKQEYQALRYPGNLADEVLKNSHRNGVNVLIRLGAVAAIAAAVLIFIRVRMNAPSSSSQSNPVAIQTPQTDEDTYSDADTDESQPQTEVASFGELPAMSLPRGVSDGLDLAPSAPDFSFSAPSFTTTISDEQSSESSSTTKESA